MSDNEQGGASSVPRGPRFPASARWTLVFIVVMVALIVAIWPRGDDPAPTTAGGPPSAGLNATDAPVADADLVRARNDAALPNCPVGATAPGTSSVLADVTVPCLATGAPYDVGAGTAGKPLVINMWAVWCLPCRREMPELAEYARRAGDRVNVLAVHAQEGAQNPYLALQFLIENQVRLPVAMDVGAKIAAALGAPRVFPSTILVRPDGTVAKILPQIFHSPDEIAAAVREHLGVDT